MNEDKLAVVSGDKQLTLLVNELQSQLGDLGSSLATLTTQVNNQSGQPTPTPNVPQAVNQLVNGDFSFSWPSWAAVVPSPTNGQYECYDWYSFPASATATNAMNTYVMYPSSATDLTATFTSANVNIHGGANPDTIDITAHGLATGQGIYLTGSTPPTGLTTNTLYYAIVVNANRISVASTAANAVAGTVIQLMAIGSGTTKTFTTNYTLKNSSDTYYSAAMSEWQWTYGTASFEGSNDISTKLLGNNVDPGRSYYLGFNAVRASQYVTCSDDVRISVGLYGYSNSAIAWGWLYGTFDISYTVIGDVSHGTTSREYVINAVTSRGISVQSSAVTIAAPDDYSFAHGAVVLLSWKQVLNYGVLSYDVYRKTGATYELLYSVVTGQLTYIDNNSVAAPASGYPTPTFTQLKAFTSSQSKMVKNLPYSGDPLSNQWATVVYAIRVPQNFNKADLDLSLGVWLRMFMENVNANGRMDFTCDDGHMDNGSSTLESAAGQFTADMVGLTITVYNIASPIDTFTATVTGYNSPTSIGVFPQVWNGIITDTLNVYIEGGAPPHSVWIDLVHLDYIEGAGFAPNAADISPDRGLPSVLPTHTTQGGVGTGGISGDGGIVCLFEDEVVSTKDGLVRAGDLKHGMMLDSGYGTYNRIADNPKLGVDDIWLLVTENGCTLMATKTKQVFVGEKDKTPISELQAGDVIVTNVDGEMIWSPIVSKTLIFKQRLVVQIGLLPDEHFLAGQGKGFISVSNNKILPDDFTGL